MSANKTTLVTLVCFDTVTVLDGTWGRIKLDMVNQYAIAFMRNIVCYTNLTLRTLIPAHTCTFCILQCKLLIGVRV